MGSLTMTYFRMGNPHYHRRNFVSRSCSGWEGVVPKRYGRQTINLCALGTVVPKRKSEGKLVGSECFCCMNADVLACIAVVFRVIGSSRTGN